MKLSIITPTYNRANMLHSLYESIIKGMVYHPELKSEVQIQWLIMDDGSYDDTKEVVERFISDNKIEIEYHKQENQGKMIAINHVIQYANGDLLIECDSDDVFSDNAFYDILQAYNETRDRKDIYGLCFLKYDLKGNNIGKSFSKPETTMFDLYFKERRKWRKSYCVFYRYKKTISLQN